MPQSVVLYGPSGIALTPQTAQVVDPSFAAARASLRPLEYAFPGQTFGHYRAVGSTAAGLFTANVNLANLRFAPATGSPFAVLLRLRASLAVAVAVTAQRLDPLAAFIARGYTVQETTSITALTLSGNNARLRTSMGTPITTLGVASAAAGLTGGTRAIDANPIGHAGLSGAAIAAVGTGQLAQDVYKWDTLAGHPPVLAPNEGVLLQWGATALATGTVVVTVEWEWAEALVF